MTSTTSAVEPAVSKPAEDATPSRARSIPRAGWLVIASKEFGDHILSSRFLVLATTSSLGNMRQRSVSPALVAA